MPGESDVTQNSESGKTSLLAAGGLLGALAAASCCILPLILFSLGISGAWIGNLTALSKYHEIFVVVTLVSLGAGYWRVYKKKNAEKCCDADSYCASPASGRLMKWVLWVATVIIAVALLFPYVTPYLLSE